MMWCMYVCIYIYTARWVDINRYIHLEREKERDRERNIIIMSQLYGEEEEEEEKGFEPLTSSFFFSLKYLNVTVERIHK